MGPWWCSPRQLAGVLGHAAVLGFAQRQGEGTLQAFAQACEHLDALEAPHLMRLVEAAARRQDIPKAQIQVRWVPMQPDCPARCSQMLRLTDRTYPRLRYR